MTSISASVQKSDNFLINNRERVKHQSIYSKHTLEKTKNTTLGTLWRSHDRMGKIKVFKKCLHIWM